MSSRSPDRRTQGRYSARSSVLCLWCYVRYSQMARRRWYWGAAGLLHARAGWRSRCSITLPFVLGCCSTCGRRPPADARRPRGRGGARPARRATPTRCGCAMAAARALVGAALGAGAASDDHCRRQRRGIRGQQHARRHHDGKLPFIGTRRQRAGQLRALFAMAVWPADLAVLHPYETHIPLWQPLAALAFLRADLARDSAPAPTLSLCGGGMALIPGTLVHGDAARCRSALRRRAPIATPLRAAHWRGSSSSSPGGARDIVARWSIPLPVVALALTWRRSAPTASPRGRRSLGGGTASRQLSHTRRR